jgi:hypothetical protein
MSQAVIANQLLSVAFTTTSIYVVLIIFILDKYTTYEHRDDPQTEFMLWGGSIVLLAFVLSSVASVLLLFVVLGCIPPGFSRGAGFVLGLSTVVLFFGTMILGGGLMMKDIL